MKNKTIIIVGVIILIIVIILGVVKFSNKQDVNYEEGLEDLELTGEKYIPSKIYDDNSNEIKLAEFSNKPMALLFFNTVELEANEVISLVQKKYDNYKEDINFINIAVIDGVSETKEKVKKYMDLNSITVPVLYDTEYSAKNEYKIDKIPTLVFINKNGEIINTISEDINEDVLEANLDIISENW